jgi:hypothetical protein
MHVFRDTTMHAHNFLIDQGHKRDMVKAVTESLEQRDLVPSLDLVEEAVDPCDSLTLMVSSQYNYLLWESHFKGEEEADDLAGLFTSIHVISHEEKSRISRDD